MRTRGSGGGSKWALWGGRSRRRPGWLRGGRSRCAARTARTLAGAARPHRGGAAHPPPGATQQRLMGTAAGSPPPPCSSGRSARWAPPSSRLRETPEAGAPPWCGYSDRNRYKAGRATASCGQAAALPATESEPRCGLRRGLRQRGHGGVRRFRCGGAPADGGQEEAILRPERWHVGPACPTPTCQGDKIFPSRPWSVLFD